MIKRSASEIVKQYILIVIGCALYSAGFQFFMYPNSIVVGGVTGIAMIINYWTHWPVGVMIIIMNIPLFAVAWKRFGVSFMVGSLVGMALSSVMMDLFALLDVTATDNLLLACIYGGVIKGFGLGLVFMAGATTGGMDITAKFMRQRYPYINFGTIMLLLDVVVIGAFALIFNKFEGAMYAIIANFIVSKAVDAVLYGVGISKVCYIISDKSSELKEAITEQLHRGVTLLHGEGAYTGAEKLVIFCVIKRHQITDVRRIIKSVDPRAFFIVTDAGDVFGNGFGDISEA
ncbi:MAG: YitT family protein [Eubacteriales bacterium]|nr:YitT family protein [Eubacteriales bacterium]